MGQGPFFWFSHNGLTMMQHSFLGVDGGGTQTRWALGSADGQMLAEGAVAGMSGLQLGTDAGRATLVATFAALAADVHEAAGATRVARVVAGLTGFAAADAARLQTLLAAPFALTAADVQLMSDIELACHSAFGPGSTPKSTTGSTPESTPRFAPAQGIVVYAGTGSIAAHIDSAGVLHRAGGRGALIDDAGGGYWIGCQGLKAVWRLEDADPGSAAGCLLGQHLFKALGGNDWAQTRQFVYGASRGEMGLLALAVAAAAEGGDADALAVLRQAGLELARLAECMQARVGVLPLALSGRVFDLHPIIEVTLRAALPVGAVVQRAQGSAHVAACRWAAAC